MKITTQFCVFLENITDRTADICASLALEGINIVGLSIADAVDYGVARLVVDDPYSARGILQDSRYAFTEVSVLTVEAPHNPGALAELLRTLVRENVRLEYAYTTAADGATRANVVIRCEPLAKALEALQKQLQFA
ncbi:MAG: amino acid-binding protein [Armatimonadetes bacterium]|jgi:hypothetical protein|nr:amino acid-binding protein [Armatimonadota bacterium]